VVIGRNDAPGSVRFHEFSQLMVEIHEPVTRAMFDIVKILRVPTANTPSPVASLEVTWKLACPETLTKTPDRISVKVGDQYLLQLWIMEMRLNFPSPVFYDRIMLYIFYYLRC
jgi:hypothetical protein